MHATLLNAMSVGRSVRPYVPLSATSHLKVIFLQIFRQIEIKIVVLGSIMADFFHVFVRVQDLRRLTLFD